MIKGFFRKGEMTINICKSRGLTDIHVKNDEGRTIQLLGLSPEEAGEKIKELLQEEA